MGYSQMQQKSRQVKTMTLSLLVAAGCGPASPVVKDNTPHPPIMVVPNAERLIGEATDRNIVRVEIEVAGLEYMCSDPAKIELFVFQNFSTQRAALGTRDATARFTFKKTPTVASPNSIPIRSDAVKNPTFGFARKKP